MKIIICGAGKVGSSIAKHLVTNNNDVTVIDQSSHLIDNINEKLDINTIIGSASNPSILKKAGADEADMIIAVTLQDEINMVACQMAHTFFKIPRKIARLRSEDFLNPIWRDLYNADNMPIDLIISPELEVAKSIERQLKAPGAFDVVPFLDDEIELLSLVIEESCPLIDTNLISIHDLFQDNINVEKNLRASILGINRDEKLFIPKKEDKLNKGDHVYILTDKNHVARTLSAFGLNEKPISKIIIVGGGNIGFNLAKNIEESFESARIKIIEKNKERAEFIANELNNSIIINGDALDEDVLSEANLEEIETVLALTNDDEDNLMISVLVEKFSKNKKTMALTNKSNYSLLQSSLKIDDLIDPRMSTVSSILKHVHKGTIESAYSILDGEYEVIEAEIIETSELINKELKNSNLPDEIRIGAILRGDDIIIPRSNFIFQKDDKVVFLARNDQIQLVENIFRISSI